MYIHILLIITGRARLRRLRADAEAPGALLQPRRRGPDREHRLLRLRHAGAVQERRGLPLFY